MVDAQTLTLDFASTILEICQAPALPKTQGKSWKKLVSSGDEDWRTSWYYEYNYEKQFPYTPNVRALRTDRWKYIRYPHGDGSPDRHMAELYDLQNDPKESTNLIAAGGREKLIARLSGELDRLIEQAKPWTARPHAHGRGNQGRITGRKNPLIQSRAII